MSTAHHVHMTPTTYTMTYNVPIGGGYPDDTGTYDVPAHGRTPAQMLADHMRHLCACADLVPGDADYCDTVTVGDDGRYRPDTDADVWAGWWWTVTTTAD